MKLRIISLLCGAVVTLTCGCANKEITVTKEILPPIEETAVEQEEETTPIVGTEHDDVAEEPEAEEEFEIVSSVDWLGVTVELPDGWHVQNAFKYEGSNTGYILRNADDWEIHIDVNTWLESEDLYVEGWAFWNKPVRSMGSGPTTYEAVARFKQDAGVYGVYVSAETGETEDCVQIVTDIVNQINIANLDMSAVFECPLDGTHVEIY